VFGGFAMISSGLFGAQGGEWLQPSDVFRMALVFTWAWGAVIEIRQYWATVSESARLKAQRSVALDLHDGMAQELSLIASYLYAPADERGSDEWHRQIQGTAERALAEVRRTISTLATDPEAASALNNAWSSVSVDVLSPSASGLDDARSRESIVFIVREAVTNALRHGRAGSIRVQLSTEDDATVLRVIDNGVGFDANGLPAPGHFGLASMEEKAASLGASLFVHSAPGVGTTVEILWL